MSKKTKKQDEVEENTEFEYAIKIVKKDGYYVPVEIVIDNDVVVHRQEFSDSILSHALSKAQAVLTAHLQNEKKVK